MTRRALVLTDETAGHPFLRTLPPHVRADVDPVTARERVGLEAGQGWASRWGLGLADLRQFLGAYCATFLAVVTFFA